MEQFIILFNADTNGACKLNLGELICHYSSNVDRWLVDCLFFFLH